ncbi:2-oxoacid:acceptor oxidoreductase family protein [Campylobacterota bacterium]
MYRIRFHGRGGQGIKVTSRILGSALFMNGYEIQDAPRYGAERRGAPIFAYVRASKDAIYERGIVRNPDLIVVADESLIPLPAAAVRQGADEHTILLLNTRLDAQTWKERLNFPGTVLSFDAHTCFEEQQDERFTGAACVGAASRLLGLFDKSILKEAINEELQEMKSEIIEKNITIALKAYDLMHPHERCVHSAEKTDALNYIKPHWVQLPFEDARTSAPVIHATLTSENVPTGLWRTLHPIIHYEHCHRCWWNCSTFCPDSAINVNEESFPVIDYDHCKGCLICSTICPSHAIEVISESEAKKREENKEQQ